VEPPRTGSFESDLIDPKTGSSVVHYAVDCTDKLPSERTLALIVAFHGTGGNAISMTQYWAAAVKRNGLGEHFMEIAPKAQGAAHSRADDEGVTKLIDWALATYPIDPRQVYANGFSAGGWYAADYGLSHQERFAAISMYGAGMRRGASPGKDAALAPPFYLVAGEDDPHKTEAEAARRSLAEAHFRFVFREVRGWGHWIGTDPVVDDDLHWMAQQRSHFQPPSKEQEEFIRRGSDAKKAGLMWSDDAQAARLVALGGEYAAALAARVAKSKEDEVRVAVAKHSQEGWFSAEHLELLMRNMQDKSAEVRQESLKAIARAAGWNSHEGRQMLVAIAGTKHQDLADRRLAVQSLGEALKLILLADHWDDNVIIPGLATLLDDPTDEIRADAFAILAPLRTEGAFDYDPAGNHAKRRPAVEQWMQWAKDRCSTYPDPAPGAAGAARR